jgi:hypothetical protein
MLALHSHPFHGARCCTSSSEVFHQTEVHREIELIITPTFTSGFDTNFGVKRDGGSGRMGCGGQGLHRRIL